MTKRDEAVRVRELEACLDLVILCDLFKPLPDAIATALLDARIERGCAATRRATVEALKAQMVMTQMPGDRSRPACLSI